MLSISPSAQVFVISCLDYFESFFPVPDVKSQLTGGKNPDAGKDWGQEEKGMTEDEMVGWHDQLSGYEPGQTPGDN